MNKRVYLFLMNKLDLVTRFCDQAITITFFFRRELCQMYSSINVALFVVCSYLYLWLDEKTF